LNKLTALAKAVMAGEGNAGLILSLSSVFSARLFLSFFTLAATDGRALALLFITFCLTALLRAALLTFFLTPFLTLMALEVVFVIRFLVTFVPERVFFLFVDGFLRATLPFFAAFDLLLVDRAFFVTGSHSPARIRLFDHPNLP
jgi:hypothetical protein